MAGIRLRPGLPSRGIRILLVDATRCRRYSVRQNHALDRLP